MQTHTHTHRDIQYNSAPDAKIQVIVATITEIKFKKNCQHFTILNNFSSQNCKTKIQRVHCNTFSQIQSYDVVSGKT